MRLHNDCICRHFHIRVHLVYCESGIETAVLRQIIQNFLVHLVYCESGIETSFAEGVPVIKTLYGKGIPASFRDNFSTTVPAFEADWKANLDKFKR